MSLKINFKQIAVGIVVACITVFGITPSVFAEEGDTSIMMSPMNEKVILNPGDSYSGSFDITNPSSASVDFDYVLSVVPFYVNEDYNIKFSEEGSYNQMVDWVTILSDNGKMSPGESETIRFRIDVPENAPAGGQYAAIKVASLPTGEIKNGMNIQVTIGSAYLIYANVAGVTEQDGEILSADVQSFLLDGNITGSSMIKNTGNVHGVAKYTLQVFPLFSSEEVYTNEDSPKTMTLFPDRTYYDELSWDNTPAVGIFNVSYTVEFEGVTTQVSKMVIKCPIWLLFIIIFAIIALIIYIFLRMKNRKTKK